MPKYLPVHEVAALATQVASAIQLKAPTEEELCLALMQRYTLPQVISDGYTQLWVDKLYIAYSCIDDPVIHYVYITDRHISEEFQSYRVARKERKNEASLPESIMRRFQYAAYKMGFSKKNYVVFKNLIVNHSKA